jgi:hypothetical protein
MDTVGTQVGVLFNEAIFVDLILAIVFGYVSGVLWSWLCYALKL